MLFSGSGDHDPTACAAGSAARLRSDGLCNPEARQGLCAPGALGASAFAAIEAGIRRPILPTRMTSPRLWYPAQ